MMAAILNSAIMDSTSLKKKKLHSFILTQLYNGSHLEFYHLGFSYFAQKHFTHTFWLNLMIAAILNSAFVDSATVILNSDTLLSSFRFTQKHSHSSLTQTNSIWLKLIHSYLTWWCQPSWNLPSWIQPFWTNKYFTHSFWPNFMMAVILNTAILDSAILHKTLSQTNSFWLNLMMSDILNSAILDSAILNKKKTSLIHSDSTWWCQTSIILPSWIQPFWTKKNFTHSFWLNLMMAAILNSSMLECGTAILDSDTLLSSLRFTQKHSHATLTLLKVIQSDSNSFILT